MKKHLLTLLLLSFACFAFSNAVFTTTGASTDWNNAAAWSRAGNDELLNAAGDGIPDANDRVVINHPIIVGANNSVGQVNISPDGTNNASLTIQNGFTLTIATDNGIGAVGNGNLELDYANVTTSIVKLLVAGNIDIENDLLYSKSGASGAVTRDTLEIASTGSIIVGGDATISNTSTIGRDFIFDGAFSCDNFNYTVTDCPVVFNINDDFTVTGDFSYTKTGSLTNGRDTLSFNAGTTAITGDAIFSSSATATGDGNTIVIGSIFSCTNFSHTVTDFPVDFSVSNNVTVTGDFTYNKTGTATNGRDTFSHNAGTLAITGNANFTSTATGDGNTVSLASTFNCVDFIWSETNCSSLLTINGALTASGDFFYTTTGTSTTVDRDSLTVGTLGSITATDSIQIASTGVIGSDFLLSGDVTCGGGINIFRDVNNGSSTRDHFLIDDGAAIIANGSRIQIRGRASADLDIDIVDGSINANGAGVSITISLQTTRGGDVNMDIASAGSVTTTDGALIIQNTGTGTFTLDNDGTISAGNGSNLTIRSNGASGGPFVYNQTSNASVTAANNGNIIIQNSNDSGSLMDVNLIGGSIATSGATSNVFFRTSANIPTNLGGLDVTITDASISAGNDIDFSNDTSAVGVTILIDGAATLTAAQSIDILQTGNTPLSFNVTGAAIFNAQDLNIDDQASGVLSLSVSNGTYNISNNMFIDQNANGSSTNTFLFSGSSDLNITGNLQIRQNGGSGNNEVTFSNATTDVGGVFQLNILNGGTGQNLVDLSAGTYTINGNLAVACNDAGHNELDITGSPNISCSTFNVNNNSSGNNNVWLGENVTLNAAAVTINGVNASGENNATFSNQGTVTGNFTITNDKTGTGINNVQLGTLTEQATFTVGGNLNLTLNQDDTQLQRNVLSVANANITVNGNLNFNNSALDDSGSDAHQLLIDETNFPGTQKSIALLGNFNPTLGNTSYVGGATDFVLNFNNTGTQNWGVNADGTLTLNNVVIAATSTTQFVGVLTDNDIQGTASVNGILSLNGNTPTISGTDQIHVNSGGTLLNTGAADAMLYDSDAIQFESDGLLEFNSSGGGNIEIMNTANFIAPNVILTGSRTKRFMANINGTNQIGHLDIQEGSMDFDAAVTELSLTDALSTVNNQALVVNASTILNFNEAITTFTGTLTAEDDSEVQYTNNSTTLFPAEYFLLTISGNVDKVLTGTDVIVRDKFSKSGTSNVDLDNTYLTLFSNQVYDGFIGEITGSGDFVYNGVGRFILDKRISITTEDLSFLGNSANYYRDLTVPIQEATLANFQEAGITLYKKGGANGFTDWGNKKASILYYVEDSVGTAAAGFTDPDATTDLISSAPNGGWKLILGARNATTPFTFKDTGMVYTKNQTLNLTFTSNAGSDDATRSANDGWHLIGNPYACTIDLNALIDEDEFGEFIGSETNPNQGILGKVWVQAPFDINVGGDFAGGQEGNYAFYNAVTDVGNIEASKIPSHQSFWMKTFVPQVSATSGSFQMRFKESHKLDNQEDIRKSESQKSDSPALFNIELLASNKDVLTTISFHEFAGASEGYDPVFDIEKFNGSNNSASARLDFYLAQNLNLRVNAIGKKRSTHSFDIDVKANAGNYALNLAGLVAYAKNFGCAFLHDKVANTHINLKDTTLSVYEFVVSSNEMNGRFTVDYNLSNSIAPFEFYNPTCHNDKDGGIVLDLSALGTDASFDVVKDGEVITSVNNLSTKFKSTFPPGAYTIVDRVGNLACSVDKTIPFTIENPPLLTANFTTEPNVKEGQPTVLINTSLNADAYEWYFADDMSYSSDATPSHTFTSSGKHMVTLTTFQNDKKCVQQINQYVFVNELTGVADIANEKSTNIAVSESTIIIQTFESGVYQIHGVDGKQVKLGNLPAGTTRVEFSEKGAFIVTLFVGENTVRQKIIIP